MIQLNQYQYITKNKDTLSDKPRNEDNIYLITQIFLHSDPARRLEILQSLKRNIQLEYFSLIYLLNEQIFTKEELDLNENEFKKIKQINIRQRLKFCTAFNMISKLGLKGYVVISNCDIFFDKTLNNLRKSCLSISPSIYTLLRFEYLNEKKLGYCKLCIEPKNNLPRNDSQDTWIIHTNYQPSQDIIKNLDFYFGRPGCDNKLSFVFQVNGYTCYNEPWKIKSYHHHKTSLRNYTILDRIPPPYLQVIPII